MTRKTPLWLQAGSYSAAYDRELIASLWPAARCDGCQVSVYSGMTVQVAAGRVVVPSQNGTGCSLCVSDQPEQVILAAAPASGTNRYDLITCQPRANDLDGGQNTDFIFTTVTGVAAATPVVPATPLGSVSLAQIYVPGGSASVTAGNITDTRPSSLIVPAQPPDTSLLPRGILHHGTGPPSAFNGTGNMWTYAPGVQVYKGRKYKMNIQWVAPLAGTANTFIYLTMTASDGSYSGASGRFWWHTMPSAMLGTYYGSASLLLVPPNDGVPTYTFGSNGPAVNCGANSWIVALEDIGGGGN